MQYKILIFLSLFLAFFGFTSAQKLGFSYGSGDHFGKGCLVSVDVTMDVEGKNISATDLMLITAMKYVDFVPNQKTFPYGFPPVMRKNGVLSIVRFATFPDQLITGTGTIGTLYFQANPNDIDASVKFYFLNTGNTKDSNLSYDGIDLLQSVDQAHFIMDQTPCTHEAAAISGGFAGLSYEDGLSQSINQLNQDVGIRQYWAKVHTYILFISFGLLLLALVILVIVYRRKLSSFITYKFAGKRGTV